MACSVELSSDSPDLQKLCLSPATFPDTATGGTRARLEVGSAATRLCFVTC